MSEIQQTRWDQLVRRVAGIIGPGSKVSNTIGDLFPMLDVENLPGELYLLSGTRLGSGGANQLANAGEVPRVQLFNPANSGLIATITSVIVSVTAIETIKYIYRSVAENTNTFNQRVRDLRLGTAQRTTCEVRAASEAVVLSGEGEFRAEANVPYTLTDPNGLAVLSPGTGMTFQNNNVATQLRVIFFWRERVAEQSELNF